MDANLLTVTQVEKEYGIEEPRLRSWLHYGKLKTIKIRGATLVQRGELLNLLEIHCETCGKLFFRNHLNTSYCSNPCKLRAYRARHKTKKKAHGSGRA